MAKQARDSDADEEIFARLISPVGADEFFASSWQQKPELFLAADAPNGAATRPIFFPEPLGWAECCDLLMLAAGANGGELPDGCDLLIFKNRELTHDYDSTGPCGAIIDGASCVVNHAEYVFSPFSELCLQLRRRLLHVYANAYVTPARSQAVSAHADDRDVFILQLKGTKHWKVYEEPPTKLPYSEEQVGKNGLIVPDHIFRRPMIEHEMQPGDVLYMPRGFVHEASCSSNASWHVTLAVATHDWSWSKALTHVSRRALDSEADARWRAAVPLSLGLEDAEARSADVEAAESEMAAALQDLQKAFSVPNLRKTMADKLRAHNMNQEKFITGFQNRLKQTASSSGTNIYWRLHPICLDTCVRRATKDEFTAEAVSRRSGKGRRGLVARDEVAAAIIAALEDLRGRGTRGALVSELGSSCTDQEAAAMCDELTKICLARLCVFNNSFRIASAARDPAPSTVAM